MDLSSAQLGAIEHARAGGELQFQAVLIAEAWQNGNWTPTKQTLSYRSPISVWSCLKLRRCFRDFVASIPSLIASFSA